MKLAWATDIHLDHLKIYPTKRRQFFVDCFNRSDALVVTGDLSSGLEAAMIGEFAEIYSKPIYFVIGNHDFWGTSFRGAAGHMRKLCKEHTNLHWLTESEPIDIAPGVQICGVDGWYDAQYGDWEQSDFIMVDWRAINDLKKVFWGMRSGQNLIDALRKRAAMYAELAQKQLEKCTAKHIIFATHVPPYEESAWYRGQPSSRAALPWYTNKLLGVVLAKYAVDHPDVELETICGHVHWPSTYRQAPNHVVRCGSAEYGAPEISEVFDL